MFDLQSFPVTSSTLNLEKVFLLFACVCEGESTSISEEWRALN